MEQAARWIAQEAAQQQARPRRDARGRLVDAGRAARLLQGAERSGQEAASLLGEAYESRMTQCTLAYARPSAETGLAMVPAFRMGPAEVPAPPLWVLESACRTGPR